MCFQASLVPTPEQITSDNFHYRNMLKHISIYCKLYSYIVKHILIYCECEYIDTHFNIL